jgi:hypothetical protein
MARFKPKVRSYHTATLIDNKLYILDGEDLTINKTVKSFFYLDVSVPFNTKELAYAWKDLSSTSIVPIHEGAASAKGGANNDTLFLYGGNLNEVTALPALVYTFDPQNNEWSIPNITGSDTITRKQHLLGIIDNNGKMYLWSGALLDGSAAIDMLILDTINLSWRKGSLINAPTPRVDYGAVLTPDNKIIYMGK